MNKLFIVSVGQLRQPDLSDNPFFLNIRSWINRIKNAQYCVFICSPFKRKVHCINQLLRIPKRELIFYNMML